MSIGLVFWIAMLVWLLLGLYSNRASLKVWAPSGLLIFLLLALLGWAVFGPAIHR